jgi:hypothetical protein
VILEASYKAPCFSHENQLDSFNVLVTTGKMLVPIATLFTTLYTLLIVAAPLLMNDGLTAAVVASHGILYRRAVREYSYSILRNILTLPSPLNLIFHIALFRQPNGRPL